MQDPTTSDLDEKGLLLCALDILEPLWDTVDQGHPAGEQKLISAQYPSSFQEFAEQSLEAIQKRLQLLAKKFSGAMKASASVSEGRQYYCVIELEPEGQGSPAKSPTSNPTRRFQCEAIGRVQKLVPELIFVEIAAGVDDHDTLTPLVHFIHRPSEKPGVA